MRVDNLKNLIISPEDDLRNAIKAIERGKLKITLVMDNNKLVGVLNDGDIRRFLLEGNSLNDLVSSAMNTKFISKTSNASPSELYKLMRDRSVMQIPILNEEGSLESLFIHKNLIQKNQKYISSSVVLMAGGKGKRLLPLTENCPKPMLEVNGEPMLEGLIKKLRDNGFLNFYISVNYLKDKIIDYFDDGSDWGVNITYLVEELPLGTAGSLSLLPKEIIDPILVMNADVLTNFKPSKLLEFHKKNNALATLAVLENEFQVPFGVVETDGMELSSFREKPVYRHNINAGIYIVDPKLIELIKKGTFEDMPTFLIKAIKNKNKVVVYPIHEYWIDVGVPETFNKVVKGFNQNNI